MTGAKGAAGLKADESLGQEERSVCVLGAQELGAGGKECVRWGAQPN